MHPLLRRAAACAVIAAAGAAAISHATNYSLWVNGREGGGQIGNYADFTYWGPATTPAGVNKKAVNWDGQSHISEQNYLIRNALDCFCTGTNWCYVAAHSAGDLMMGYTLSLYGASTRNVKTPSPAADGSCSNAAGNPTQVGWNIKWLDIASGAAGGSELADDGAWATGWGIDQDLKVTTARALYDHNQTANEWFYMWTGAKGAIYSFLLPGEDDQAVAYHSTGAIAGATGGAYCNPADWLCNNLTLGTAPAQGNHPKWSFHSVNFRDDKEAYAHFTNGNWQGTTSLVRQDMVNRAQ